MVSWQTPLCPFKIDFEPAKLEDVRVAVLGGFYTVPRGGIEIGGVLYGTYSDGRVEISEYQKIETEYLTGPSFELSENDRDGLRKLLNEGKFSSSGLRPVGWFRSRTRTEMYLSEKDLELYSEFFPEPWQVVLVLKPDRLGEIQCGYFFRNSDGTIKADASVLEFPLWPLATPKKERAAVEEPEPQPRAVVSQLPPSTEPAEAPLPRRQVSWLQFVRFTLIGIVVAALVILGYWVATR
jgi:proteasome lid subunit RPN8/RPN11